MTTPENASPGQGGDAEEPVVKDNRKIDPETGEARGVEAESQEAAANKSEGEAATPPETHDDPAAKVTAELDERTRDLQRLQAEYANYRKRVDRDRQAVREQALANVLTELLPVLDDVGRAREHGELTGGFAKVGEALENVAGKLGLERFGERGEAFDPMVHEALMHSYSAEVDEPTCVEILQTGYRIGERTLRPARVAVAEPGEEELAQEDDDEPKQN